MTTEDTNGAEEFMRQWVEDYEDTLKWYPYSLPNMAMRFDNIDHLMRTVRDSGSHFFDPETLKWHKSRVSEQLHGNRFFVTSEKDEQNDPRLYTVRYVYGTGETRRLQVAKLGGFQRFKTSSKAHVVAAMAATILS